MNYDRKKIQIYDNRWFFDGDVLISIKEVVELLNHLHQENQQLTKSRDYWSKKTKEFSYYFNCLEKAIEKTFDSDDQCFEEIWKYYDKMEKKWEYD